MRAASPEYIGLMNPNHMPVLDWVTMIYMYEKLIHVDANYKPTVPWLAESWEFIDDVTVIMKRGRGVVFHDGSPSMPGASNTRWTGSWTGTTVPGHGPGSSPRSPLTWCTIHVEVAFQEAMGLPSGHHGERASGLP
jgi:hypothetical protein